MPFTQRYTFSKDELRSASAGDGDYYKMLAKPVQLGAVPGSSTIGYDDSISHMVWYGILPIYVGNVERLFFDYANLHIYIDRGLFTTPFFLEFRIYDGYYDLLNGSDLPTVAEAFQLPLVGKIHSSAFTADYLWVDVPLTFKRRDVKDGLTLILLHDATHHHLTGTNIIFSTYEDVGPPEEPELLLPHIDITYKHYQGIENYDMNNY